MVVVGHGMRTGQLSFEGSWILLILLSIALDRQTGGQTEIRYHLILCS